MTIDPAKNQCPQAVLEAINNARNIEEIVRQRCPKDFQILVRPLLKTTYENTMKLHHILESTQRLEMHLTESTFPPQILGAIKNPKLQFKKNFDAEAGNNWTITSSSIVT